MSRLTSALRRGRGNAAIAALFAVVLLTSCRGVPVVSDRGPVGDAPVEELREWVADEVGAVIEVTGLESHWRMLLELELRWAEDREAHLRTVPSPALHDAQRSDQPCICAGRPDQRSA